MVRRIDLLRHGEPVGGRKYRGQIDDPLSDKGWQEMRQAVDGMDEWDVIVHSPLVRCSAFAEELSRQRQIPAEADDRLKEIGFGVWEGKTGQQIRETWPGAMEAFYLDPVNNQPDGAERLRSFYLRVTDAWEDVIASSGHDHPLLIAHAGVMRAIVSHVLKAPLLSMYRMQITSAGLIRITFDEGRPPTLQTGGG